MVDWTNTSHYMIRFTPSGEADLTMLDGSISEAFAAAESRALKLGAGEPPKLSLLTVIDL